MWLFEANAILKKVCPMPRNVYGEFIPSASKGTFNNAYYMNIMHTHIQW